MQTRLRIKKNEKKVNCKHKKVVYYIRRRSNILYEYWTCLNCHKYVGKRISNVIV